MKRKRKRSSNNSTSYSSCESDDDDGSHDDDDNLPLKGVTQWVPKKNKKRVDRILLIFPKKFEFTCFALSCDKVYKYTSKIFACIKGERLYECLCVEESDCLFSQRLVECIMRYAYHKQKLTLMLMGSCGMAGEDAKLGQWFVIDNAYQADRGFLDEHNCFLGRKDKIPHCGYHMRSSVDFLVKNGFESTEIASSNFLNQCSYNKATPARLFDMETYYFYSVCKQLGIQSYVALRYTTDLVMEPVVIKTEMLQKTEVIKMLMSIKESLTQDGGHINDALEIIDDNNSALNEQIKPLSDKTVERKEDRKLKRELQGIEYSKFFQVFANADCLFWDVSHVSNNSIDCRDELIKIRVNGVNEALKNVEKIPIEDRSDESNKIIKHAKTWLLMIERECNNKDRESSVFVSENFGFGQANKKISSIEAFVYCALREYGLKMVTDDLRLIEFQIDDFNHYYHTSNDVFSRKDQDMNSRIKDLRRFFPDFPSYKELFSNERCVVSVSLKKNKGVFSKLQAIVQRQKSLMLFDVKKRPLTTLPPKVGVCSTSSVSNDI